MVKLLSKIDPAGHVCRSALALTSEKWQRVEALIHEAHAGGVTLKTRKPAGKLFPRERIQLLSDRDTPFLELSPIAGHGLYDSPLPSGGIITGIAPIHGRPSMIIANDWTVKAGTFFPITIKKILRAQEIAQQNRLPTVYLVDSGGAFLPMQSEIFADRDHGGRTFYNQCIMSSLGIPQVGVAMGHCTAGGAYTPTLCDYSIIVRGSGAIFLGGPPLVKAATGEVVPAEELGGAQMHCSVSGVSDYAADDDTHAMKIARELMAHACASSILKRDDWEVTEPPAYDENELDMLAPQHGEASAPAQEIIARLVDGSDFLEFKRLYGPTLTTGFGRLFGHYIGIVASNGPMTADAACKGAHFVQLCEAQRTPLVFLVNVKTPEDASPIMVKQMARMTSAVTCATVPKITVVTGEAIGPAAWSMCMRPQSPRFLFHWPGSVTFACSQGEATDAGLDTFEKQSSAVYSSARCWDDGIIRPATTRRMLGDVLDICTSVGRRAMPQGTNMGVFRL